jgi:hypothetical protein
VTASESAKGATSLASDVASAPSHPIRGLGGLVELMQRGLLGVRRTGSRMATANAALGAFSQFVAGGCDLCSFGVFPQRWVVQ